jgi:hypothetical protein
MVMVHTSNSTAARTNLTSDDVRIGNQKLGVGAFRVCLKGTFVGGRRNTQAAACKRFKQKYLSLEAEFFAQDFQIADRTIRTAEVWNACCDFDKKILISKGTIHKSNSGIKYLVEPLIRDYEKFTSNNGWIGNSSHLQVRCMEAFTHFSYHESGGQLIVCDIQGRYKKNRRDKKKSRFELGDPAICSRRRLYGPTDLGEKGIDSFFDNHVCNEFCEDNWNRPQRTFQWFPRTQGTSMLSSQLSDQLLLTSRAKFRLGVACIMEEVEEEEEEYAFCF